MIRVSRNDDAVRSVDPEIAETSVLVAGTPALALRAAVTSCSRSNRAARTTPVPPMPPSIAFSTLEQQKARLLADIDAWSPPQLTYRPTPAAWSAAEVLDHIVRVEREILAAAQRGLPTPHRRGASDRLRFILLDWLFRSDRRVRVPGSVPQVLPAPHADLGTVRREWDVARQELGSFLAPLTADQLSLGVFRHPVAGWMSVPQVLRFFWVHTHHHGYQLDRLRAASTRG